MERLLDHWRHRDNAMLGRIAATATDYLIKLILRSRR
jgi:hypothetical protein